MNANTIDDRTKQFNVGIATSTVKSRRVNYGLGRFRRVSSR
jgi:hypothetical protein